ncbi:MAG TPA: 6-phosphogluconolactonase [Victivallales bacterium]|nr:6-phosphogluconolactonase [Victivallales bacterium]
MNINYQNSYETMSQEGADFIRTFVNSNPEALICFATGSSPKRIYEILAYDPVITESNIRAVMLDEWIGIDTLHPSTCRYFAEQHIFKQWNIPEKKRFCFNASAVNAEKECRRMASILKNESPIDLCILGLGSNGHLGLNEPSDILFPHAHVTHLDAKSQTHSMLADEGITLSQGITFGMTDINCSQEILMLVCGKDKKEIASAFIKPDISTHLPASFLHLHPKVFCIIDKSILK